MARVKDLWYTTGKDAEGNEIKTPTKRHPDKGGSKTAKRWLACWTGPNGKEATKAFTKKQEATNHSNAMEADRLRGIYIEPFSSSDGLSDTVALKDGDGLAQVAGLGRAAA